MVFVFEFVSGGIVEVAWKSEVVLVIGLGESVPATVDGIVEIASGIVEVFGFVASAGVAESVVALGQLAG